MNNIERLAERYRVPVKRDECGDRMIRGRNGHLYVDAGQIMVCFTDDGRKKSFGTKLFKTKRLQMLPGIRLTQDGDYEFIGEISESLVWTALFRVLGVKRFKATKGEPRPEAKEWLAQGRRTQAIKKGTKSVENATEGGRAASDIPEPPATRFNPAKGVSSRE